MLSLFIRKVAMQMKKIIVWSVYLHHYQVFERLLYWQMCSFTESLLSINQCDFRNGFSVQHCLITMLEKWRTSVDNKLIAGILRTDLSKALDCLIHDLVIAKLHAYGFDHNALLLISPEPKSLS